MKRIFKLTKSQNGFNLFSDNGGLLFYFDNNIYRNFFAIKGIAINLVKLQQKLTPDHQIELIDDTNLLHPVCAKCGSINVELKGWIKECNGDTSTPDEVEDEDTWCSTCDGHEGAIFKLGDYVLYSSKNLEVSKDLEEDL